MDSQNQGESKTAAATLDAESAALERIRAALRELRYGTVTIVVQDGVIVQIERTEKVRLR